MPNCCHIPACQPNSACWESKHCSTPSLTSLSELIQTRVDLYAMAMNTHRSSSCRAQPKTVPEHMHACHGKPGKSEFITELTHMPVWWHSGFSDRINQPFGLHHYLFDGKALEDWRKKTNRFLMKMSLCVQCQSFQRKVKFFPEQSMWRHNPLAGVKMYYGPLNLTLGSSSIT